MRGSAGKKNGIIYPNWREKWVDLNKNEKDQIIKHVDILPMHPSFTLLLTIRETDPVPLFSTIESIVGQLYPHWILHINGENQMDSHLSKRVLDLCDSRIRFDDPTPSDLGDWIIELTSGTQLHEAALFASALAIIEHSEIAIIYSDHDHVNVSGNFHDPHMKPDWNRDLFAAMNYMEPLVVCKKWLWASNRKKVTGQHEFLLKATRNLSSEEIFHIPHVLASVLTSTGNSHREPSVKRIRHNLPFPEPLVSILIPTRDQGRMLKRCLESIYRKTEYTNFEIILVDHETSESKALKVIEIFRNNQNFHVTNFSGPFNYAAIMNHAAKIAEGQVLVLLNNDTEIIESDWLTELVSQISRPDVGVVGALLLFSDDTIQHAGVHPGVGGLMGHGHKHLSGDSNGYFNRLKAVHEVAAVTGACLVIEKTTWVDLGGLDEKNLPIAYNDIDLCLKARQKGLKVIFTPFSRIVHHESVSRGVDEDPDRNERLRNEISVMQKRWGATLDSDPAYSPNLSLDGGGFKLSDSPKNVPLWKI